MRIRTFDNTFSHDKWYVPYSYSCPFVDPRGKHCEGNHGYQRHLQEKGDTLLAWTRMAGMGEEDPELYWQICTPCWTKMRRHPDPKGRVHVKG